VSKKLINVLFLLCLFLGLSSTAIAQRQTGSIKGKITDNQGLPLARAFVYVSSPALLGVKTYFTSDTGLIRFPNLPPGRYEILAELPEFKTTNIKNIIIQAGKTAILNITMERSTAEEEITIKFPSPMLDVESAKITSVIDKELLENIPMGRDLYHIVNLTPGLIQEGVPYLQTSIIHGSTVRANTYSFDGMSMNDPGKMVLLTHINFDILEEIELGTAAHPVEVGYTEGGYINVVTKSGGNKLNGEVIIWYTSNKVASNLWPEEELSSMGVSPPVMDKYFWDLSFSLGGSFLEDKLWFFGNSRLIDQKRTTPFFPWIDPQEKSHQEYTWYNKEKMAFIKLTNQFSSQLKITGMFNYFDRHRPVHQSFLSWNLTEEATRILDNEKNYLVNGAVIYNINQNTFFNLKGGYVYHRFSLLLNEEGRDNPRYFNEGTGQLWGSARFNEKVLHKRFQAGACLTRFQDSFLGGNHELKIGAEYEYAYGEWNTWKEDNLLIDYYYGSPYYFGLSESPATGNTVGKGRIHFYITGKEESEFSPKNEQRRYSFYIQDSATFASRFTLSLGLRFDRSHAKQLAFLKKASGNPVSLAIGEELIEPLSEINPYGENDMFEWKNMMIWNAWSPRVGLSFDIFGNGKTVFKASFSRYSEYSMLQYLSNLNPFCPGRSHQFFWYDENMDGQVDINDTYTLFPEDYRLYIEDYYKKKIAPDIKSPYTNEFTVGLQQEVFSDFSVRINYIHKNKSNIFENVLYDPDLGKDWYTIDQDTENWWLPFTTIVPGNNDYPDTPVTVYFWSKNAPLSFDRVKNVPELKRKYQALEFVFKKRMSNNWQLYGSLVLSKTTGNIGLGYDVSSGFSAAGGSPNYFINFPENSRLDFDRPLVIKLMGTYRFPYDFFLSFSYIHMSGTPWIRSILICPPSSWTEEKNAYGTYMNVLLEEPGTRRNKPYNNLDCRIEKEFRLGDKGRISFYVDIINALGNKYQFITQNDGGFWFPSEENSTEGIRVLSSNYNKITSVLGTRAFRLSLKLSF